MLIRECIFPTNNVKELGDEKKEENAGETTTKQRHRRQSYSVMLN